MPAKNDPGPSVKDKETYEALREDGASKQKAARIANAKANDSIDHDSRKLEDRTKDELYEEAQEIFKDQAPWATIAHSVVYMTMRPEVENYVVHPLGGHIFNQVGLKQ